MKHFTAIVATLLWLCAAAGCNKPAVDPAPAPKRPDPIVVKRQVELTEVMAAFENAGHDLKVIEAWQNAGAKVGFHETDGATVWYNAVQKDFDYPDSWRGKPKNFAPLPAFAWDNPGFAYGSSGTKPKPGVIGKLPVPTAPFALFLSPPRDTWPATTKELARLTTLHTLDLRNNEGQGADVTELAALKNLHTLSFDQTDFPWGLKGLAELKSLQNLDLSFSKVGDKALKGLGGLKSLKSLNLVGTQVTDAGLKELAGLTSLQNLNLSATDVTDAGVAELQRALPKLKIER